MATTIAVIATMMLRMPRSFAQATDTTFMLYGRTENAIGSRSRGARKQPITKQAVRQNGWGPGVPPGDRIAISRLTILLAGCDASFALLAADIGPLS
jgi:hypothetical protein